MCADDIDMTLPGVPDCNLVIISTTDDQLWLLSTQSPSSDIVSVMRDGVQTGLGGEVPDLDSVVIRPGHHSSSCSGLELTLLDSSCVT